MPPIKELSGVNNRIQESSAAADRVFEIIDTLPAITDRPGAVEKNSFNYSVEFDNVSFRYEDAVEPVLTDISFKVHKGEVLALGRTKRRGEVNSCRSYTQIL
jgi:ATP-binding cassette, subfamily B, bacterial MsbA